MSKIFKLLFSRLAIVCELIILQAAILIFLILKLSDHFVYVFAVFNVLSIIIIIWLVSKHDNPSVKLPWVIMIMIFPIFGGLFYLFFGLSRLPEKEQQLLATYDKALSNIEIENKQLLKELKAEDSHIGSQFQYLKNTTGMFPFQNTTTEYLPTGESLWSKMKEELQKAEHTIFMEYFIIQEGKMWNEILDILIEKANQGLDVRLIYDDIGCIKTLPFRYNEKLEKLGVKCVIFNPFKPELNISFNNRDHRKITVIDGHTGFTGGANLADEYINEVVHFGHWKDSGIMLKGEAVWNLTKIFLTTWNVYRKTDTNFQQFTPHFYHNNAFESDGTVLPFTDSPFNNELIGETVYLNIISYSSDYLYINTPYLIVDNELVTALSIAAKRGVDVRIVTPGVPDKWYVHLVTQAYYTSLIEAGVKIYEYTPGFIHSKTFVADDSIGFIGTINMDYRSLYHHYECGCLLYESESLLQLKQDYIETLSLCKEITAEFCLSTPLWKRFLRGIIRIFAPLM